MSLKGWEGLKHDCGSDKFIPQFELIWQDGMGQATRPAGYMCAGCNGTVDTLKLINAKKQRDLEAKIKELEAERG